VSDERTTHAFLGERHRTHRFPTLDVAFEIEALCKSIFKFGTRRLSGVGLATKNDQTEIRKRNLGTLDLGGSSLSPQLCSYIIVTLR
jgi:hypothetical protein